ncbi:lipopolysaccharide transport periplasmic protein LptA [bacterium]|nr:lipopolysaccharide transport periplasmic protein LptA [bacterium]
MFLTLSTELLGQAKATDKPNQPTKGVFEGLKNSGAKDAPVTITSNTLQVDDKTRQFVYAGNVKMIRDILKIDADKMIGTYDQSNQLTELLCLGNVVIIRGEDMRATSQHAVYDPKKATVVLTQNPEVVNKQNALAAAKITLYVNEDRSEAEGEVRVKIINHQELNDSQKASSKVKH